MFINETTYSGNPIIKHKYTADPTAIVYQDKVYLFTGHDEAPPGTEKYIMNDWLCFSSADLVHWEEHPFPLKAKDFSWASGDAYASKVVQKNNLFSKATKRKMSPAYTCQHYCRSFQIWMFVPKSLL